MPFTDEGVGYRRTDTSKDAAKAQGYRAPNLRWAVILVLKQHARAMTTEEIAEVLEKPYCSVQPRLSELQEKGIVRDSGARGTSKWNRPCIKWILTENDREP